MSPCKQKTNWLLKLYQSPRTVFGLADVALLTSESDAISLIKKLHYQVGRGNLRNPRKGVYTKPIFDPAALACNLYTPSYLSLDYVLQKEGILFQYDSAITAISYLSRSIEIDSWEIKYRKIKDAVLLNTTGIISRQDGVNIATVERAFLDMIYLNGDYYFDSLNTLNKAYVNQLIPIYQSKVLLQRVKKLL
jgi:hypothetical protein